ncbi:MAG: ABC transporter permease subunit [Candidatus Eisenbacteria bacterium]|nr:ABC transporter permease subunit [Candidatus Eisenbacteria bacterium]
MNGILTIARLTLYEARQRRILLAMLLCGVTFVVLFAIGFYFIGKDVRGNASASFVQKQMLLNFFIMAGLYAINFMSIMTAVLMSVDTLSGEIGSGVMQTVAAKPIHRSAIVLGKWLAHALVLAGYLLLLSGGVLAVARSLSGVTPPNVVEGLAFIYLGGLVLLSLSVAGGARFSTITNGVVVFGLYGLAFVGGWIEQVGAMTGNAVTRQIGTIVSLLMPSDSMWRLAAWHLQPSFSRDLQMTPFFSGSVPSGAMVIWTVGYVAVTLVLGLWLFRRRGL